ncbi:MAG: methylamine utilization protein [Pseudomonadales bacterium]|nr:methylamine utilization protein [Pseudomonadales bacterium]
MCSIRIRVILTFIVWVSAGWGLSAQAADITISLVDKSGKPFEGAVVSAIPQFEFKRPADNKIYNMSQVDKVFSPHILAIPQGSMVSFPNMDNITHHVYSFSKTKRFDLKLFKLNTPEPVKFEKTGEVVVGCNIHDWMLGYIKVVPTHFIARTDKKGKTTLSNLPAGDYVVEIWHPRFKDKNKNLMKPLALSANKETTVEFSLKKPLRASPDLTETDEDDY